MQNETNPQQDNALMSPDQIAASFEALLHNTSEWAMYANQKLALADDPEEASKALVQINDNLNQIAAFAQQVGAAVAGFVPMVQELKDQRDQLAQELCELQDDFDERVEMTVADELENGSEFYDDQRFENLVDEMIYGPGIEAVAAEERANLEEELTNARNYAERIIELRSKHTQPDDSTEEDSDDDDE